jgi:hypothetical protein
MVTQTPEEKAAADAAAKAAKINVNQIAKSQRELTKAYLDKQPKITLLLELRKDEPTEEYVSINDVQYYIPRGKEVEVPLDVAKIIKEKMRAEGKLGQVSREMMANMPKAEDQV